MKGIVKEKQPFERLEVKKEDLLKMFSVSRNYKVISLLFLCVLNSVSLSHLRVFLVEKSGLFLQSTHQIWIFFLWEK